MGCHLGCARPGPTPVHPRYSRLLARRGSVCSRARTGPPPAPEADESGAGPTTPAPKPDLAGGDGDASRFRPYPAFRLLAQCLAVTLPLGVGGVDLVGRAIFRLPAPALSPDQAASAAVATEALTLAAVVGLFSAAGRRAEGGVRLPMYEASLESVLSGVGGAVGGAALAAAFSLAWDAVSATPGAALDSPTTDAVGALLRAASPGGAAALVTASALLAPAVEELVYRGAVLAALLDGGVGPPAAVALASAAFAASHAAVAPADTPALFGLGLGMGAAGLAGGRGQGGDGGGPARVDLGAATLAHGLYNLSVLAATAAAAAGAGAGQG